MADMFPPLAVPDELANHPELMKRDITLDYRTRPYGNAYFTRGNHIVKVVKEGSEEAAIYKRLLKHREATKHTLPCEIIESNSTESILILPWVEHSSTVAASFAKDWALGRVLNFIYQVLEGIDCLHQLHIAHLDIAPGNIVVATPHYIDICDPPLPKWRAYIIDFGESRQLQYGPGHRKPIELPASQCNKPTGVTSMDPYSWDVHCVGQFCEGWFQNAYRDRHRPRVTFWLTRWLMGNECSCSAVCNCRRPTIRRVRRVLGVLCWVLRIWGRLTRIFSTDKN